MNVALGHTQFPIKPLPPPPTEELNLPYGLRLLGNFPVSQVEGRRCTLLAGNLFISLAGREGQINFSQQCSKMFKIASDIFIHTFLLFLGLFLKIFCWVSLSWGRKRVGRETLWTTSWGWGRGGSGKCFLWRRALFWSKTSGKHSPRFLNRSTTVICKYPWRHVFIFAYNVVNATCAVITGQVKFWWPNVPTIRTLNRLSKSLVNLQHTQETTVATIVALKLNPTSLCGLAVNYVTRSCHSLTLRINNKR